MGFFNKVKKAFESKAEEKEKVDKSNNAAIPSQDLGKASENVKSFRHLDNLIHSGEKRIELDSDIVLEDSELQEYREGITIEDNDIVIDGKGFSIDARKKARIFTITSQNIVLKNITLKNASISGYHFDPTDTNAIEDIMNNNVLSGGAAIQNLGQTIIESSKFLSNESHSIAGVILNGENASLKLKDCEFKDNQASEFAVIDNFSKLEIDNCLFENNIASERGGVIGSAGELEIIKSKFINNHASQRGGAIMNWGNIKIHESLFDKNDADGAGGFIFNQQGHLFISNSLIANNSSSDGGAIFNFDSLSIEDSKFMNNTSRERGGAIFNYEIGKVEIKNCEFKNNDSYNEGSCIYNKNKIAIIDSIFEENNTDNDIIFNLSELKMDGLTFSQNNANSLVKNNEGAQANLSGGRAMNNSLKISSIVNLGEFFLNEFTFKNNLSNAPKSENIHNEGNFNLPKANILNPNAEKTILNKSYMEVKELTKILENTIFNEGELRYAYREENCPPRDLNENEPLPLQQEEIEPNENKPQPIQQKETQPKENKPQPLFPEEMNTKFNFNDLENLILSSSGDSVDLDDDISLLENEIYFYEGGIELDRDNLTINGNGKCIDGRGKTRIFNVIGRDIVLKNIIFKNGSSLNNPYGGGAINIIKGASLKLINCKFIGNSSLSDGGAIYNRGQLKSINTEFEGNKAKEKGGGIFNNGIMTIEDSAFLENRAKRGLSIYNNASLSIESISFDNELFNNDSISTSMDLEESIANIGFINRKNVEGENFTYLFNEISLKDDNIADEINLEKDIIFNYIEDKALVNGFEINESIIINGNNHIIDGKGSARLFNVSNDAEVVFKNLIFRNCYSSTQAIIENNSSLTFENCKFINNHPRFNESLIENNGKLKIIETTFSNHYIRNSPILLNNEKLEIKNSSFVGNFTESKGSVLSNYNRTDIKGSRFENNFSNEIAGAILNLEDGRLDILSTKFIENISGEYGGAIFNYGDSTIMDTEFLSNSSKNSGGALYNALNPKISGQFVSDFVQNLLIEGCDFKNNSTERYGGALYNAGVMDLQISDFIENTTDYEGGAIYMGSEGIAYIGNCSFKKNKANDGGAIYQPVDNIRYSNCSLEYNTPNDTNLL